MTELVGFIVLEYSVILQRKMKKLVFIIFTTFLLMSCEFNEIEFVEPEIKQGKFIDLRDNQEYEWVKIGNQVWMAENLAYLPVNFNVNANNPDLPNYFIYGYCGTDASEAKTTENYLKYGVLYNFEAAKISCPPGWHLPTDEEWKQLELALGMSVSHVNEKQPFSRGTNEGSQLKSASGWDNGGNGSNSTGFSAIPGGFRFCNGNFWFNGDFGFWWSSTSDKAESAWVRSLSSNSGTICRSSNLKQNGFSVRCVRDN